MFRARALVRLEPARALRALGARALDRSRLRALAELERWLEPELELKIWLMGSSFLRARALARSDSSWVSGRALGRRAPDWARACAEPSARARGLAAHFFYGAEVSFFTRDFFACANKTRACEPGLVRSSPNLTRPSGLVRSDRSGQT